MGSRTIIGRKERGAGENTACRYELMYEMPIAREFAYLLENTSFFERQKSHFS